MTTFQKSDYENAMFHVGPYDEDGNAILVVDGKPIGQVNWILEFLGRWKLEADRAKAVPTPDWLTALQGA